MPRALRASTRRVCGGRPGAQGPPAVHCCGMRRCRSSAPPPSPVLPALFLLLPLFGDGHAPVGWPALMRHMPGAGLLLLLLLLLLLQRHAGLAGKGAARPAVLPGLPEGPNLPLHARGGVGPPAAPRHLQLPRAGHKQARLLLLNPFVAVFPRSSAGCQAPAGSALCPLKIKGLVYVFFLQERGRQHGTHAFLLRERHQVRTGGGGSGHAGAAPAAVAAAAAAAAVAAAAVAATAAVVAAAALAAAAMARQQQHLDGSALSVCPSLLLPQAHAPGAGRGELGVGDGPVWLWAQGLRPPPRAQVLPGGSRAQGVGGSGTATPAPRPQVLPGALGWLSALGWAGLGCCLAASLASA